MNAPLPPPKPPVDPKTISRGPWRGHGWVSIQVSLGGPIDGVANPPASTELVSGGYGAEVGVRVNNWLGFGISTHRTPHAIERELVQTYAGELLTDVRYDMSALDLLILKGWLPLDGRIQPFVSGSGGLALLSPAYTGGSAVGSTARVALGTDFWVHRIVSLDAALGYRLIAFDAKRGHVMRGSFSVTFHF